MNETTIGWIRNPDGSQGYTLNSKTGCLNHTPEGLCLGGMFPCYAFRLANGRLRQRYLVNHNYPNYLQVGFPHTESALFDPFYPRFWPERLKEPYRIRKPIGFFLDDMSDWMGDYWPREWTEAELQMMRDNPQHRIYTLTKQPENLLRWSPFPENCWVGISVTNNKQMNKALYFNPDYKAKIKFLSFEPLLERIDKSRLAIYRYDWLIIGACTGSWRDIVALSAKYPALTAMSYGKKWTLQPKLEWVLEIVEAADKTGIPVFLKDNLKPLLATKEHYGFKYVPLPLGNENGRLRQEMPG